MQLGCRFPPRSRKGDALISNHLGIYDMLAKYSELRGISFLIDRRFDTQEETIVRLPDDVIAAFWQSKLNFFALGPFLVWETASASESQHPHREETCKP